MSLIRSLFERVVDNLRARVRRVEMPKEMPRNPAELLALAEGAVRMLLMPPSVGGTPAEIVSHEVPAAPESPAAPETAVAAASEPPLPSPPHPEDAKELAPAMEIEAAKFALGPITTPSLPDDLDDRLAQLPEGYGDGRIFLLPRSPSWLLAQWDFTNEQKEHLRRMGGAHLGLRLFDVSDRRAPGQLRYETRVDELARSYYLQVVGGRTYVLELGYWTTSGTFLSLGLSGEAEAPPEAPRPGNVVFATIPFDRPASSRAAAVRGHFAGASSLTPEISSVLADARASLSGSTILSEPRAAADGSRFGALPAGMGDALGTSPTDGPLGAGHVPGSGPTAWSPGEKPPTESPLGLGHVPGSMPTSAT